MLEEKYDLLIHHLEGMIADGVALVHGGRLFAWENTNIPGLLRAISEEKRQLENLPLEPGDLLENVHTGQRAAVINAGDGVVNLTALDSVLTFPKEKLWLIYKPVAIDQD